MDFRETQQDVCCPHPTNSPATAALASLEPSCGTPSVHQVDTVCCQRCRPDGGPGGVTGFPDGRFELGCPAVGQGVVAHQKALYRMFGNAVAPPLIAALAGALLANLVRLHPSTSTHMLLPPPPPPSSLLPCTLCAASLAAVYV